MRRITRQSRPPTRFVNFGCARNRYSSNSHNPYFPKSCRRRFLNPAHGVRILSVRFAPPARQLCPFGVAHAVISSLVCPASKRCVGKTFDSRVWCGENAFSPNSDTPNPNPVLSEGEESGEVGYLPRCASCWARARAKARWVTSRVEPAPSPLTPNSTSATMHNTRKALMRSAHCTPKMFAAA
ncbi:hypothetical protein BEUL_1718 [Bifidobacterium eulemuris]|uniref:Uncharacterized protein n=1 Tax=Bifidobacterium eulemuris TaxID=1765219 RepID=A0A261G586_9BIFI|nr:hypothetical protein BEUL_1718 [Bifidobacterium eulemuris]